nr:hypothetical protein [Gammaproteobacteria bacterium]
MTPLSELFTLKLPDDWTPQETLAAYERLNDRANAIWNRYELVLIEQLRGKLDQDNDSPPESFDFDDPLPF